MPYPILLAAGALAAGAGAGLQIAGTAKAQSAQNNALTLSMLQQQKYQKEATDVFNQSLQQSSPDAAHTAMATGQQRALQDYQRLQQTPLSASSAPMQSNPSAVLVDAGKTRQSNLSQAALQGYSEFDLQQAIKDLEAQGKLGVLGNFSRGTQSILPVQLNAAGHAGDSLQGIGSILGAAGTGVGMLGALGYGPMFGAAAASGPALSGWSQITKVPTAGLNEGGLPTSAFSWNFPKQY